MQPSYSQFMNSCRPESAFEVLALAKRQIADGKNVIELEIGDSPFASSPSAVDAGVMAIQNDRCHYGPSAGIPEFREAAADYLKREYGVDVGPNNIVAGAGAKTFQQLFCELFVDPGDSVLVFTPHFPTYPPNILRRGARIVYSVLEHRRDFRPNLDDVEKFIDGDSSAKAIFLNSPHNPTGGVATHQDMRELSGLIRGKNIALFSDEPYDRMAWSGEHHTPLAEPDMLDHCVAAYTFSKSYSMSGWRLGFAASSEENANKLALLTNTALSCVPPFTQLAGVAAINDDDEIRDERMMAFRKKVESLVTALNRIDGIECLMPGGSFYVFPSIEAICQRHQISSHGFALFLLEAADSKVGVACLGGECFGEAGFGFLRLSTAEPEDRLNLAVEFIRDAIGKDAQIQSYLEANPQHRLGANS
jgi:aspartate aminotransferase